MKELRVELPRDLSEERMTRVRQRVLETIIIDMWQAKELSTREAADQLGMTYREYLDLLGYYRVPVTKISDDETLAAMLEEIGQGRAS